MSSTKLTRTKLCREYGITERTLRFLESCGLLTFKWGRVHGMLKTTVTKAQAELLSCARLDIHTLVENHESLRIFPFQRFMTLRFFQVEADELYEEMVSRNMIHPHYIKLNHIEDYYGLLFENLPEDLKKMALAKDEPNKKQKPLFDHVLAVTGLQNVYERPEIEQGFEILSESNIKILLDSATTSCSDVGDICDFLRDCLGVAFTPNALLFYQWLFSDFRRMRPEDLQEYFKSISVTHRDFIKAAFNRPIAELKAEMGLLEESDAEEVYELARRHTTKLLLETMKKDTYESQKEFHNALKQFMAFVDRDDRKKDVTGNAQQLPQVFTAFTIEDAPMDTTLYEMPKKELESPSDEAAVN